MQKNLHAFCQKYFNVKRVETLFQVFVQQMLPLSYYLESITPDKTIELDEMIVIHQPSLEHDLHIIILHVIEKFILQCPEVSI